MSRLMPSAASAIPKAPMPSASSTMASQAAATSNTPGEGDLGKEPDPLGHVSLYVYLLTYVKSTRYILP